jgi:hypothetical protein
MMSEVLTPGTDFKPTVLATTRATYGLVHSRPCELPHVGDVTAADGVVWCDRVLHSGSSDDATLS